MGVVMVPIIDINYLVVEDLYSFFHNIVYVMFSLVAVLRGMIETAT